MLGRRPSLKNDTTIYLVEDKIPYYGHSLNKCQTLWRFRFKKVLGRGSLTVLGSSTPFVLIRPNSFSLSLTPSSLSISKQSSESIKFFFYSHFSILNILLQFLHHLLSGCLERGWFFSALPTSGIITQKNPGYQTILLLCPTFPTFHPIFMPLRYVSFYGIKMIYPNFQSFPTLFSHWFCGHQMYIIKTYQKNQEVTCFLFNLHVLSRIKILIPQVHISIWVHRKMSTNHVGNGSIFSKLYLHNFSKCIILGQFTMISQPIRLILVDWLKVENYQV